MKRIKLFLLAALFFSTTGPLAVWAGGGFHVSMHGNPLTLMGQPLEVGQPMPDIQLPDTGLKMVDFKSLRGKATIISIVPSIDTRVCEKQTHILSEENEGLDQSANLVPDLGQLPQMKKAFDVARSLKN